MAHSNKFITDENDDGYIIGVKGERTIIKEGFNNEVMGYIEVLITREKGYYNLYIIDERFKREPLNTLHEQIPLSAVMDEKTYFNKMFLECRALEHYLWFKYGNEELSFNIEVIKDNDILKGGNVENEH